jgi:hypothetical protein
LVILSPVRPVHSLVLFAPFAETLFPAPVDAVDPLLVSFAAAGCAVATKTPSDSAVATAFSCQ